MDTMDKQNSLFKWIIFGIVGVICVLALMFVYDRVVNFTTVVLDNVTVVEKHHEPAHTKTVMTTTTLSGGGVITTPTTRHVPGTWRITVSGVSPISDKRYKRVVRVSEETFKQYDIDDEYNKDTITIRERIN